MPRLVIIIIILVVVVFVSVMAFESLPADFEWDQQQQQCDAAAWQVYDQGPSCLSCCAFAVASALSLRECNQMAVVFSPRQIWDCLGPSVATCARGTMLDAMEYQMSGGANASYFLLPGSCTEKNITGDPQQAQCASTFDRCRVFMPRIEATTTFLLKDFNGPKEYGVILAAKYMMSEIMTNGPVVAVLELGTEEDMRRFTAYASDSDIFYANSGSNAARHCIMVYGWGQDDYTGAQFWKVQNSYGLSWGNQGRGKIARGTLEHEWRSFYATQPPPPKAQPAIAVSTPAATGEPNHGMTITAILSVTAASTALMVCLVCTLVTPQHPLSRALLL